MRHIKIASAVAHKRPSHIKVIWHPPDALTTHAWVEQLGVAGTLVCLTVLAPNPTYRADVYSMVRHIQDMRVAMDLGPLTLNWKSTSLHGNIVARVDWSQLLATLAEVPRLEVEEDTPRSPLLTILQEARLLLNAQQPRLARLHLRCIHKWMLGVPFQSDEADFIEAKGLSRQPTDRERFTQTLFWLTLARSNGLFDRVVFPIDGFDDPSREEELLDVLRESEEWAANGCPLGYMIGVKSQPLDTFGESPLGIKLQESLL